MAYKNVHQFMGSKTQAIVMTIVATVTVLNTGFGPFGPMVAGAQPASFSLSPMQDPLVEASRNPQLARALQDAYEAAHRGQPGMCRCHRCIYGRIRIPLLHYGTMQRPGWRSESPMATNLMSNVCSWNRRRCGGWCRCRCSMRRTGVSRHQCCICWMGRLRMTRQAG